MIVWVYFSQYFFFLILNLIEHIVEYRFTIATSRPRDLMSYEIIRQCMKIYTMKMIWNCVTTVTLIWFCWDNKHLSSTFYINFWRFNIYVLKEIEREREKKINTNNRIKLGMTMCIKMIWKRLNYVLWYFVNLEFDECVKTFAHCWEDGGEMWGKRQKGCSLYIFFYK